MNTSNKLLSDLVSFRTYSKYLPHQGRREILEETINRDAIMHLDRFPKLSKDIMKAFRYVHDLKIMPSMRTLQFSGEAIIKNNARGYNCSAAAIDNPSVFSECLFLLLSGVGFGFSVQKHHVNQLPKVSLPTEEGYFVVHDSIEGWAQALDLLIQAYFFKRIKPVFDFAMIRPKGSYLVTTGAQAPGPQPLKAMLEEVEKKLKLSIGRKLRPIEVHDIICIISECVLAGGIRRAALISLFDKDDTEMLFAKSGEWWVKHPYRARANNSAMLLRDSTSEEEFKYIFKISKESGSGEPGFNWVNSLNSLSNPCVIGETEILTREGYKRIDSLVDKEIEIWNGFEWSKVVPKVTGKDQEVLTVSFSNGLNLTCTKKHKFYIAEGYKGTHRIVEAQDLEPGMKLIKHEFPVIEHGKELNNAYTQGFVSAEGMDDYDFLFLYYPKYSCIERLEENASSITPEYRGRRTLYFKNKMLPKSFVPFEYNLKSKLDWLSGLFDGDGCELKEGGLQLASINRQFLVDLQKLLTTVGVTSKVVIANKSGYKNMPDGHGGTKSYLCKEAYRICIGSTQMQFLKSLGLSCERLKFNKNPQRDASQFISVTDITESGVADTVYCFTENKRHSGIFNGVITGQCNEISLNSNQFCNLSTINQTGIKTKKDFLDRVYSATLLGTLQAAYTDFPYLRPVWKEVTEREALLGVSFTGVADAYGVVTNEWLQEGAQFALEVNLKYAKKLGINPAARVTTVKPEGTSSCVLGSSSGIHARHSKYYLRRFRINRGDSLDNYLRHVIPELVENDVFSNTGSVITIPQESPEGAITRADETALSLLQRAYDYNVNWISPGHRDGIDKHNVSVTISVKDTEWEEVCESMWLNRNKYRGISLLPYDGGSYQQAPFEECSKDIFIKYSELVKNIDLTQIHEEEDNTKRTETVACAGGACEISNI